jgi:hypothetical protein
MMLWPLVFLLIVATQATYRLPLQRVVRPPLTPSDVTRLYESFENQRHHVWHGLPQVAQAPLDLAGIVATAPLELAEKWAEVRKELNINLAQIYTASFKMGTPPRTVELIVDTGSADLWVKAQNSGGYDVKNSSSANVSDASKFLQYGTGEVTGHVAKDKVCVGDMCVDSQYFLLASKAEDISSAWHFDGLLGLGLPGGARVGKPALSLAPRGSTPVPIAQGGTILERLNDQHAFGHLAFALDMYTLAEERESSITFGDAEELAAEAHAKGLGAGVRAPLVQLAFLQGKELFWSVKVDISLSGVDPIAGNASYIMHTIGVLDSGTTLIGMPAVNFALVMEVALGSAMDFLCRRAVSGMIICDCTVDIKPVTIAIPGADGSSISVVLGKDELLKPLPSASSRPMCALSIMPTPRNMPTLILGEAFLRHVHTIHDFYRRQVIVFPRGSKGSEQTQSLDTSLASKRPFRAGAKICSDGFPADVFGGCRDDHPYMCGDGYEPGWCGEDGGPVGAIILAVSSSLVLLLSCVVFNAARRRRSSALTSALIPV